MCELTGSCRILSIYLGCGLQIGSLDSTIIEIGSKKKKNRIKQGHFKNIKFELSSDFSFY